MPRLFILEKAWSCSWPQNWQHVTSRRDGEIKGCPSARADWLFSALAIRSWFYVLPHPESKRRNGSCARTQRQLQDPKICKKKTIEGFQWFIYSCPRLCLFESLLRPRLKIVLDIGVSQPPGWVLMWTTGIFRSCMMLFMICIVLGGPVTVCLSNC